MGRLPAAFMLLVIGVACVLLMMTSSSESGAQPYRRLSPESWNSKRRV